MTGPMPGAGDAAFAGRDEVPVGGRSAGALLKAAREREGLHPSVLAATIKVAPAKLEALEQDRYGELPNATFTRALAQSVCRSLKIDPRPVLALLPQVDAPPLEDAMGKLNTPFQERDSRADGSSLAWASKPMFVAGGLLLLAAIVVGMLPSDLLDQWHIPDPVPASSPVAAGQAASAASVAAAIEVPASVPEVSAAAVAAATASVSAASAGVTTTGLATVPAAAPTTSVPAASPPASAPAGLLQLAARSQSWIEVLDAQGQVVFSRTLAAGEAVAVDARPPLRLLVGNASGSSVTFRGQPTDLAPYTRNNVARLELR